MIVTLLLLLGAADEPPAIARDEPPALARTTRAARPRMAVSIPPGWHEHRCQACGAMWQHGIEQRGNVESHRCPVCGRVQWQVYRYLR